MSSNIIYKSQLYAECLECGKSFYKKVSFQTHKCKPLKFSKIDIRNCPICQKFFSRPDHKTCGKRSCFISYGNIGKIKSEEEKIKISNTIKNNSNFDNSINHSLPKNKQLSKYYRNSNILYPYTRIYYNKCFHCELKFIDKSKQKFCHKCISKYNRSIRDAFIFTFDVFDYPELFNLNLIHDLGWFNTITNINGVSRDHRISINDAIKYNYKRYYIKHPLNCEILTQRQNSSKGAKSSISYEQLVELVDNFDNKI